MKKISFALLTVLSFIIVTATVDAQEFINDELKVNNTDIVIFKDSDIKTIKSKDQFEARTEQFNISYSDKRLYLYLDVNKLNEQIDLSVSLVPGQLNYFKNNVLLGTKENINDSFELVSFRIEENSTNDMMLV